MTRVTADVIEGAYTLVEAPLVDKNESIAMPDRGSVSRRFKAIIYDKEFINTDQGITNRSHQVAAPGGGTYGCCRRITNSISHINDSNDEKDVLLV